VHSRISQHLHANNILNTEHYRFRKEISTEDALVRLEDSLFTSINQQMNIAGIFFDLVKTFDCMNHEVLLTILHFYGIGGVSLDWFMSY
jgi:hypothetical protein